MNSAKVSLDWIEGTELRELEKSAPQLSAGMIMEMRRNLVWTLQGMASILAAASDAKVPVQARPKALQLDIATLDSLRSCHA